MKIGMIAMSGVRACDPELVRLGMTLPGFVERGRTIASLPSLGLLTLAGAALLWTRRPKMGSLALMVVFAVGLVIGAQEHFFVAGPNNVFDIGNGDWTLPFKINVALLVSLEVVGLSAVGRLLTLS